MAGSVVSALLGPFREKSAVSSLTSEKPAAFHRLTVLGHTGMLSQIFFILEAASFACLQISASSARLYWR